MAGLPELDVFYDGPPGFAPRAAWVLDTLLAQLGRRARLVRKAGEAGGCALAYASAPVPGVPTLPCSPEAAALLAADAPLPEGAFAVRDTPVGPLVGAFGAAGAGAGGGQGFAAPFDLVASAFALLACWDEHTCGERDRFGRLPYGASLFAANPALRIDEPAVDACGSLLRAVLAPRLDELAAEPLRAPGWLWRDGGAAGGYAVAVTHDLDNLWRWTPRGLAASGYRGARALRAGDGAALRREAGDLWSWLTVHLPRRSDPFWTFQAMLEGEDSRGVSSSFYVIASHGHKQDGNQPRTYRRRIPAVLDLLRRGRREVGLHGNDADRLSADSLGDDRDDLAARAGGTVAGIRFHYLRCLYHETLPLLEQAGFAYDTSLAFAEHEGFRCGTAFPFHPYSLALDRPLDLVEVPLAIMDQTLVGAQYRALPAESGARACTELLARVAAFGGGVAVLWHNNRFDRREAEGYDDVYWRIVDRARADGAFIGRADALVRRFREAVDGATA